MSQKLKYSLSLLGIVVFILVCISLRMIFFHAPTEKVMGPIQKIFYYHVPSAMATFFAFFIVFVTCIIYLITKNLLWDHIARSAAEVGVLFCTIVLITGPIWAKKAWGTWWTWEARLTTTLVLWIIYVAYLLIRGYAENREQAARYSSVLGIAGFLDVPIIYFSVKWWRGQHPIVFGQSEEPTLTPEMLQTFFFCLATIMILSLFMIWARAVLSLLEDRVSALKEKKL